MVKLGRLLFTMLVVPDISDMRLISTNTSHSECNHCYFANPAVPDADSGCSVGAYCSHSNT
jgi:hypothetical protein